MKYLTGMKKGITTIVAGGLVSLVLALSPAQAGGKNNCHKWNFKESSTQVCVNNTWMGTITQISEYDKHENITKYVSCFGTKCEVSIYQNEYDDQGRLIKCSGDWNADGVWDRIETHKFDKKGKEIKFTIDNNGDGKIDYMWAPKKK